MARSRMSGLGWKRMGEGGWSATLFVLSQCIALRERGRRSGSIVLEEMLCWKLKMRC